jgi:hypothetical protein
MEWITTKHIQSTDGKTEKIYCELRLNFPTSQWNKNEKSPVIHLFYYDYKVEGGWWIDKAKTKWYTHPPHKHCEIRFNYFQRMPEVKIFSSEKGTHYNDFTIDFCKEQALKIFTERLNEVLSQCGGKI